MTLRRFSFVLLFLLLAASLQPAFAGPEPATSGAAAGAPDLLEEISDLAGEPVTGGNRVELLVGGPEYFPRRLALIASAEQSVDLVMSLWCADDSGMAVAEALAEAAGRGVRVRVIVDYLNLKRPFEVYRLLDEAAVDWIIFNPPRWGWRINDRIHEKILVVDGEAALLGGANLCDEYMLENAARGLWSDYEILAHGPLAGRTQTRFDETWNRIVDQSRRYRRGYAAIANASPAAFATGLERQHTLGRHASPVARGESDAVLHYQQPYHDDDHPDRALALYARILDAAEDRVILQVPYVVPAPAFKDALIRAAARGVEVTFLTNSPETTRMGGFWAIASRVHYRRLLEAGVRVYESPVDTVHGKAILVDDRLAVVGSHNFTTRSFRHNGEVKVITDDRTVVERLSEAFSRDRDAFVEISVSDLDEGGEPRGLKHAFGRLIGSFL